MKTKEKMTEKIESGDRLPTPPTPLVQLTKHLAGSIGVTCISTRKTPNGIMDVFFFLFFFFSKKKKKKKHQQEKKVHKYWLGK